MGIRVLIADDHAVVRRGLRQILQEDERIHIVDEASTGREALSMARAHHYDIILLDISMPDGGGLDVLGALCEQTPRPRVLVLSMYPEKQYAMRALKSGAGGYLTKDSMPDELLAAVHKVADGERYISQVLAEELAGIVLGKGESRAPHQDLSEREFQVMRLLAAGKSVGEIAADLALSVSTVSTYRARVLKKLEVRNTAEVILYAVQHGLMD